MGKTSKVKLVNKSSNKKMKSKRSGLISKLPMNKKVFVNNNRNSKLKDANNKKSESIKKVDYTRPIDEELDLDDADFSDEELKSFVHNNSANMSFLSANYNGSGRRHKIDEGIASFEKIPRQSKMYEEDVPEKSATVELLPIKGDKGLIKRTGERIQRESLVDENNTEEVEEDAEIKKEEEVEPMTIMEVIVAHQEDINKKKLQIAQLSLDIVENPQHNINKLKQLLSLSSKDEPINIRKLAILSLLEIFKDITPSYRIRDLTEEEQGSKVSREVRKVREFEEILLKSYQRYLQILDENVKECLKLMRKKKSRNNLSRSAEKGLKVMSSLTIVSIRCLSELLKNIPHFNFRSNIINVLIPHIELSQELSEAGDICFEAIRSALREDYVGDLTLEIVRTVHALSKSRHNLKPRILEVLFFLRLDADLIHATEEKGNKIDRLNKKKEAILKMSRKEKKRKRVEDKLNKELQEVEAVENRDRIGKTHTEILKFLFVIYFRILKNGHKTLLLPVVLKGLAKFSLLISVDFYGDLMNCLETLLQSGELNTEERLNCILTALKVLSGQGEVLTIDPRLFYTELYNVFLNVTSEMDSSCFKSIKDCLHIMLIKRRKQVSLPQVYGFLKRISTIILQLQDDRLSDIFMLLRSIFQLYDKCDYLLDNENFGRGVFQPEIENPEHSNADSTALWEFSLLAKFYQPDAETYCKHILNGAPSSGVGALPMRLMQRKQVTDDTTNDTMSQYFETIPSTVVVKKKKKSNICNKTEKFENDQNTCFRSSEMLGDIETEKYFCKYTF